MSRAPVSFQVHIHGLRLVDESTQRWECLCGEVYAVQETATPHWVRFPPPRFVQAAHTAHLAVVLEPTRSSQDAADDAGRRA